MHRGVAGTVARLKPGCFRTLTARFTRPRALCYTCVGT